MNTKIMLAFVAAAGIIGLQQISCFAHGKPEHHGAFTEVKEYTFELVSKDNEVDEKGVDEKKPHTEDMSFTVYVKDPSLKQVSSGEGSLTISDGKKQVAEAKLIPAKGNFTAEAQLPHHGKYSVAINFTPAGQKPLKAKVSISVK